MRMPTEARTSRQYQPGQVQMLREQTTTESAPEAELTPPIPKHGEITRLQQLFFTLSIVTALGLLAWNVVRLASSLETFQWWLPLAVLGGVLAADFFSGMLHWTADTWGSETMPIIGRRLLQPFRVHHINPEDILERRFIDINGDSAFLVIPVLLGTIPILPDETWQGLFITAITAFGAICLFTNQIHQWAHMPNPPVPAKILQDWGLILRRQVHERHHNSPHTTNYCIATGWCNRPLELISFFRRLERIASRVTGLKPRNDDTAFRAKTESPRNRRTCGQGAVEARPYQPTQFD